MRWQQRVRMEKKKIATYGQEQSACCTLCKLLMLHPWCMGNGNYVLRTGGKRLKEISAPSVGLSITEHVLGLTTIAPTVEQRWIWRVKMLELNIEKEDARNLAEFIEIYFFQNIRDNEDMDNIEYIRSLLKCLDELERVSK